MQPIQNEDIMLTRHRQNYIPDICTDQGLWIEKKPVLNLVDKEENISKGDVLVENAEGGFTQLLLLHDTHY
jgi:hypothetical protein